MRCRPALLALLLIAAPARAADAPPATRPAGDGKLPFIQVDVKNKLVRVACEACSENMDVGLEFFCVATGTNEYEAVLRTKAKASHLHLALLMIGMEAGEPVKYSEAAQKWMPPHGPPLNITCEWIDPKTNKPVSVPAYRLMRNIKDKKKEMTPFTWIFSGSKVMEDGKYAADTVGYLVSVLNNELTVIDVPQLASRDLESRQLERNTDLLPPTGTEITMVIEPSGKKAGAGKEGEPRETTRTEGSHSDTEKTGSPVESAIAIGTASATTYSHTPVLITVDSLGRVSVDNQPTTLDELSTKLAELKKTLSPFHVRLQADPAARKDIVAKVVDTIKAADLTVAAAEHPLTDVSIDEAKIKALRKKWEEKVAPRNAALREAAQAHYEVMEGLRREQQRLIDEADRVQRVIDQLQKEYSDMTTPRPEGQ